MLEGFSAWILKFLRTKLGTVEESDSEPRVKIC